MAGLAVNLPNCAYAIIGAGEERTNLEKTIAENGLSGKVALAGFIANASSVLKSADIFLLPSVKEGLPYVLLEAGLARLPVVATDVGGIPDIIENGVSGILVASGDSEAIAKAIGRLISDEDSRKICASRLEEKVRSGYNKESMLKNTILVYNKSI